MDGLSQKENSQIIQTPKMQQEQENLRLLEAILFAATEPVSEKYLANKLPKEVDLPSLINTLISDYEGRGIQLMRIAGNYSFRTAPDLADCLEIEVKILKKLSKAAVETLAIIAYKQPIVRADIEQIRGVETSGVLRTLLDQQLIRMIGRKDIPGRPIMYGTSKVFLQRFGLRDLRDLPPLREFKDLAQGEAPDLFNEDALAMFEKNGSVEAEEIFQDPSLNEQPEIVQKGS